MKHNIGILKLINFKIFLMVFKQFFKIKNRIFEINLIK